MSEKEIRSALRRVVAELDLRARTSTGHKVRRAVVPLILGAGLAVTGCGDDDETGPGPTTSTGGSGGSGGQTSTGGSGGTGGQTSTGGSGGSGGQTSTGGSGGSGGDGGSGGGGVGGGVVYMAPDA